MSAVGLRLGLRRRAMTLGVRVALFDADGAILLVRHTYTPGLYLPGGGVEPGETAEEAARRELREETGLSAPAGLELFGLYLNRAGPGRDHVALFCARLPEGAPPGALRRKADREIVEAGFFPPPPADATRSTRARLAEIAGGARSAYW